MNNLNNVYLNVEEIERYYNFLMKLNRYYRNSSWYVERDVFFVLPNIEGYNLVTGLYND